MTTDMKTPVTEMTMEELYAENAKIVNFLDRATTLDGHAYVAKVKNRRLAIHAELVCRGEQFPMVPTVPIWRYGFTTRHDVTLDA
jgi:hypothetical protein